MVLMRPLAMVVAHPIWVDILLGLDPCCVSRDGNPLGFQASQEAFDGSRVPAVSSAAHALAYPVAPQTLPKEAAGVLAALIRVE